MFLAHPTFCYEPEYPLSERPPVSRILFRVGLIFLALSLSYVILADHIKPCLELFGEINAPIAITNFYFPMMGLYLIMFLLVFEFMTNFYADISGFADRQFY
jgi:hypothetical protein